MTSYTRRWILAGPLTRAARHRRGEITRIAGRGTGRWRTSAGRSKLWRGWAASVPPEVRRRRA